MTVNIDQAQAAAGARRAPCPPRGLPSRSLPSGHAGTVAPPPPRPTFPFIDK